MDRADERVQDLHGISSLYLLGCPGRFLLCYYGPPLPHARAGATGAHFENSGCRLVDDDDDDSGGL